MQPTVYQKPEIRDANDNIIQQGAFGKNTALANSTNDGWIDYVANDLEFLYDLAKDEVVPVPALPASGQTNKTYLLTTTGVSYRWSGTQWVAVSSSEAVGRAESAALLAEQWATKTDGSVDGTEYSAKYYAQQAEASADDAQDVADDMADHLVQIDKNTGGVAKNSKRISNIEKLLQGNLYDYDTDDDVAYTKTVPAGALPYAGVEKIGGKTLVWNQLVNSGTTSVTTISGHKYYTLIDGTASIVTSSGSAITIVDDTTDMVCDLTLMYGAGNEPTTVAEFQQMFPADYYPYNAGTLLSAGVTGVKSVGKNLLDVMNPWRYGNNFYNLEIGAQLTGNSPTFKPTDNKDGTFTFTPETGWYGFIFLAEVDMSKTYRFYAQSQATSNRTTLYLLDSDHKILWKSNPGTGASQTLTTSFGGAETQYPQAKYFAFAIGTGSGGTAITITNLQLEVGSTATAYSPYMEATMPIPAAIQQLEGYGWSAGSVSNYIDFERKVFVKRVGAVNLGTLNWTYSASSGAFSSRGIEPFASYSKNNQAENVNYISDKYELRTISSPTNLDNNQFIFGTSGALWVKTNGTQDITPTGMFYYALATPIETDISAYLTDNLIEVGAGGTLTFPNSNGDDYHIPVPSDVTYMIDLQEAIENGN